MLEGAFTQKLVKHLRGRLRGRKFWICKFNDSITAGIPDLCVVLDGVTTWFEVKVDKRVITSLQAATLQLIDRAYVIRWKDGSWAITRATGVGIESLVEFIISICEVK